VIGAVIVFHDVTKEAAAQRALSYHASHDALTGLINRRDFRQPPFTPLCQRRKRGEGSYALLYIDLDQFKGGQPNWGATGWDRPVLRDVTPATDARVRASDTIARLGVDEFGVLLEVARRAGDRVCRRCGRAKLSATIGSCWCQHPVWLVPVSVLCSTKAETDNFASIMSAADIACYAVEDECKGVNRISRLRAGRAFPTAIGEMHWGRPRHSRAVRENRLRAFFHPSLPSVVAAEDCGQSSRAFHELNVRLRERLRPLVPPHRVHISSP